MNHNFVDATPTSNRREGHKKVKVERPTIVAPKVTERPKPYNGGAFTLLDHLDTNSRKVLESFK